MPGETDVVNVGLELVGAKPITSLTDGSHSANTANNIYAELRDNMLRAHFWNFSTKREKLARSSTAPGFEFDFFYPFPSDWLRTISAHDNDAGHGTIFSKEEFVGNQNGISTSADAVYLRYVYRVTDPNFMHADFRRALELSLGRDFAIPLASSNRLQNDLSKEAKSQLASARSSDAMGGFPERRPVGSWVSSRGRRDTFNT